MSNKIAPAIKVWYDDLLEAWTAVYNGEIIVAETPADARHEYRMRRQRQEVLRYGKAVTLPDFPEEVSRPPVPYDRHWSDEPRHYVGEA